MKNVFDPHNNFDEWFENDWESDEYFKSTRRGSGNNSSSPKPGWIPTLLGIIVFLGIFVVPIAACVHGMNTVNRCIVSGCKNDRQGSWTKYCSYHGCQYPSCSKVHQDGGLYCVEHTCKKRGCMERVQTFDGYCSEHKPNDKTCAVSGCKNIAVTGGRFCDYHTCDVDGCYDVAYTVIGSNYCSVHKCAYKGCPNKALTKGGMCEKHKGKSASSKSGTKSTNTNKSRSRSSKSSKNRDDAEALYEYYGDEFEDMDEAEEYWEEEYDG